MPHKSKKTEKELFTPRVLDKTVIAIPLLDILEEEEKKKKKGGKPEPQLVIIDINLEYREGPAEARERVKAEIARAIKEYGSKSKRIEQGINEAKSELSEQYLFARLEVPVIRGLVRIDNEERKTSDDPGARLRQRAIYRIWPDFKINALINRSLATVKADAARTSFSAHGQDIVWAVLDSGHRRNPPAFRGARDAASSTPRCPIGISRSRPARAIPSRTSSATARTWRASSPGRFRRDRRRKSSPWRATGTRTAASPSTSSSSTRFRGWHPGASC